ncbi:MAG: hypothetical protein IJ876_04755 [Elusimicrobiaceae bacterium]|nr:hypothetical protein [Elusimicrobiaceae bacterium]
MRKSPKRELLFVGISLLLGIFFYWLAKLIILPVLPDWVSAFVLYRPKYHYYNHTDLLTGISGFIGALSAVFLLNYLGKEQK